MEDWDQEVRHGYKNQRYNRVSGVVMSLCLHDTEQARCYFAVYEQEREKRK